MADNQPVNPNPAPETSNTPAASPAAPSAPIRLSDDMEVILPGSDKPTKYGEWFRGFQGKHTEATQKVSTYERDLARIKAEREQEAAELKRYREFVAGGEKPRQAPKNPLKDLAGQLRDLKYVNGEDAERIVSSIAEQNEQSLQMRDLAIQLLAAKLAENNKLVQAMQSRHSESDYAALRSKALKEADMGDEDAEFADMVWHSYEGTPDLAAQFPRLVKESWDKLQSAVRAADKRRAAAARKLPFVPGQGGRAVPAKPYSAVGKSARQRAEELFPLMQAAAEENT